jgi:Dipeptidyl aminopeptidases/acylaminoacyl-peptidases
MKKTLSLLLAMLTLFALHAQKPPIDHSVYDNWKSVSGFKMSEDGKYSLYAVAAQAGDGYLMQSDLNTGASFRIPRGVRPSITFDSKYGVCAISPLYEETRQAKIKKKRPDDMPKDTLAVWTLGQTKLQKFPHLKSFKMATEGSQYLAFMTTPPADTAKGAKRPPRKERGQGEDLMIYHFANGLIDTLKDVANYEFNKAGTKLFIIRKLHSKDSSEVLDGLYLYDLGAKKEQAVLTGPRKARFTLPSSNESEQHYAFYANLDTSKTAEKFIDIYFYQAGAAQAVRVADASTKGLPKDWMLSENRALSFNKDGSRLFFGIAPILPEKDTTLVDFETARLDIWHYKADYNPPQDLLQLRQEQRRSFLSYLQTANPQQGLVQLATPDYPNVQVADEWSASWAYATGNAPYRIESQWNSDAPSDLYIISLADGKAVKLLEKVNISGMSASPTGKYLAWYNQQEKNWYAYEQATGQIRNLTQGLDVAFWNEMHDSPSLPGSYGSAGWREADAAFLVHDRYDIWEMDPSAKKAPFMLTDGLGRQKEYTFRIVRLESAGAPAMRGFGSPDPISPKDPLFFSVFDNVNKYNGFYTKEQKARAQMKQLVLDGHNYSQLQRAKNGKVFSFARNNFEESPNAWMSKDNFKTQIQLSDINPQQAQYNWGTAELVSWTSTNGIPCDGILYKPEDFDPAKKYPMLIYFYETVSSGLYGYKTPAPSASTINISYFVSNGYLVFTPDIYYTIGHPGQSAMNCIMPGVDLLCKNAWVDEKNMAIQGQSWGGYQVAYMITQTTRFKAAGAGAPVVNMTSAYGGVRWGSGMIRQFQYEGTQSRIGQNLWDGYDLYIENSPLFHAPNVETPLLIMHNDKDGAVPWYQGIEYFTALRRLGKPVWMLQYNDEDHNLVERRNRKDLSIRLAQFFDHFLKGAPAPVWIKDGVPAIKKGIDWGTGY